MPILQIKRRPTRRRHEVSHNQPIRRVPPNPASRLAVANQDSTPTLFPPRQPDNGPKDTFFVVRPYHAAATRQLAEKLCWVRVTSAKHLTGGPEQEQSAPSGQVPNARHTQA